MMNQLNGSFDPISLCLSKITEGCNHRCSFCVIPSIRGKQRSRQIDSIQKEALQLVDQGVKEIILIGQDIGSFGLDCSGKKNLLISCKGWIAPSRVESGFAFIPFSRQYQSTID